MNVFSQQSSPSYCKRFRQIIIINNRFLFQQHFNLVSVVSIVGLVNLY